MLSHNHATQFKFVLQTLTLWREIMSNMPKLWLCADLDMTNEMYRLVDTGQGYQRLQGSPRVRREMSEILHRVQHQCGSWVGLSVVHLGDRDVPNGKASFMCDMPLTSRSLLVALIFIDKYTQVPRILAPIAQCIEQLPHLVEDSAFHSYVTAEWGSIDGLRMQILSDFFKHGFDGSGKSSVLRSHLCSDSLVSRVSCRHRRRWRLLYRWETHLCLELVLQASQEAILSRVYVHRVSRLRWRLEGQLDGCILTLTNSLQLK